ncbi:MAG: VOC family protein [Gemmatimonadota bacterium]
MHALTIQRTFPLPPSTLYRAWTAGWDSWFAERDTMRVRAAEGAPFFFEVAQHFEDGRPDIRHPHYGRFLALEPDALVSLTWVTGAEGTAGAETILTVRFSRVEHGTEVSLTHEGFASLEARDNHAVAWPLVLAHQESRLLALAVTVEASAVDASAVDGAPTIVASTAYAPLPNNRSIPEAALIPVRSYPDMAAAVQWLQEVLGGRERLRVPGHRVQLAVGTGAVVVAAWDPASAPATGGRPPAILMVRVADVDRAYARAMALGSTGLSEPADHPYGERQASVRDPAGHAWTLTQTIADVDPASWGGELVG